MDLSYGEKERLDSVVYVRLFDYRKGKCASFRNKTETFNFVSASEQILDGTCNRMTLNNHLFFAVMDGNACYHTSQLLFRILINAVALDLSHLKAPYRPDANQVNPL
jgi:hypothetical protein